jgi:hypothetical protein
VDAAREPGVHDRPLQRLPRQRYQSRRRNVYRDSGTSPVGVVAAPSTTFTEFGIADGTYSYRVVAVSADSVPILGVPSAAVSIVYDTLAPTVPGGVTAVAALDGSVGIRWAAASDAGSGVARYVVRRSLSSSPPVSVADGDATCQGVSTSCADATTLNGRLYSYSVFAVDAIGNTSAAGSSVAVTARDLLAPVAPTGLAAKVSGRIVTLRWKNPGDRDFDHVVITASDRKPAARAGSKRVYSGRGAKATTELDAGVSRWFTVVAYDAAGNASPAASVRVTMSSPSSFGPEPSAEVHGKVLLSWPIVKAAKYYNVQVFAGKQRILASWPAGRALQLPRAKLKRGTTYTWYVWPGFGAKAKARYGKLVGKNTFTFAG